MATDRAAKLEVPFTFALLPKKQKLSSWIPTSRMLPRLLARNDGDGVHGPLLLVIDTVLETAPQDLSVPTRRALPDIFERAREATAVHGMELCVSVVKPAIKTDRDISLACTGCKHPCFLDKTATLDYLIRGRRTLRQGAS